MPVPIQYHTGTRPRPCASEATAHLDDVGKALATGLAQVAQPVVIVTHQGLIAFTNPAFQQLAMFRTPLPRGGALRDLIDPEAADHVLERANAVGDEGSFVFDAPLRLGSSERTPSDGRCQTTERLRMRATTCRDQQDRLRYVVLTPDAATSQSERPADRQATAVSRRSPSLETRAMFGVAARVAGELAHDLNNELSVLLNYTFVLRRRAQQADSRLHDHLGELQQAAWRASRIGRAFVRFGRQRTADPGRSDLVSTVRGMEPVMDLALMGRRKLVLETPDVAVLAEVPRGRLELLLLRAAVLGSEVLPSSPLCVDLRVHQHGGGREAVLQIGPTQVEGSPQPGLGLAPEQDAEDGSVFSRLRASFERSGSELTVIPLGNDLATLELRVTIE